MDSKGKHSSAIKLTHLAAELIAKMIRPNGTGTPNKAHAQGRPFPGNVFPARERRRSPRREHREAATRLVGDALLPSHNLRAFQALGEPLRSLVSSAVIMRCRCLRVLRSVRSGLRDLKGTAGEAVGMSAQ